MHGRCVRWNWTHGQDDIVIAVSSPRYTLYVLPDSTQKNIFNKLSDVTPVGNQGILERKN